MKQTKLVKLLVLLCGLVLLVVYSLDLRNDYYYLFTKKEGLATIKKLSRIQDNRPYLLTFDYYNENVKQHVECMIKLDGRFGNDLVEENKNSIRLFYTEKSPCHVYIIGYDRLTFGRILIHVIIFLVIAFGVVLFGKNLMQ